MALYVKDFEGAKQFFEKYFDAVPNDMYYNKQTDFKAYLLTSENKKNGGEKEWVI